MNKKDLLIVEDFYYSVTDYGFLGYLNDDIGINFNKLLEIFWNEDLKELHRYLSNLVFVIESNVEEDSIHVPLSHLHKEYERITNVLGWSMEDFIEWGYIDKIKTLIDRNKPKSVNNNSKVLDTINKIK